jgi:ABC-type multidrug transport system ATPase subunit
VLRGMDLRLRPGEVVGLVGENGSGKSTLMKILVGALPADAGTVRLNGRFGYCPQEPVVYERLTCDEHFELFGKAYRMTPEDERRSRRALYEALGFERYAATRADRLSGGTLAKLNLGLALLADPQVLLLDEPTEHLDVTAADAWMATLPRLAEGRPTLVISHRLTGLESADETVVLDHGRVVERGRHEDLLALDGTYARMWAREQGFPAQRIPISSVPDDALDTAGN